MSFIDTITGINGYTFSILAVLFALTFVSKYGLGTARLLVRIALGLGMAYFLLVGWRTLDHDRHVKNKGKKITFQNNQFLEICNLDELYKTNDYDYRIMSREFALAYDCLIEKIDDLSLAHKENKKFMKMGEVRYINSKKVFTIIDSVKTGHVGLGASFGEDGVRFYILENNNSSYIIWESNLEEGEIK